MRFVGPDVGRVPFDQRDLVKPVKQALAGKRVDMESVSETVSAHDLGFEVDGYLAGRIL
jgi:transcriptional regulator NrdR family protein